MALGVDEGGEPVMRDYVLVGQVLRLEVEVVLSALRFVPNIGWSVLPTGRCAWYNGMKIPGLIVNFSHHCWSRHF